VTVVVQPAGDVRLRPLRPDDEEDALAAHAELAADDFEFLLGHDPDRSWSEHIAAFERHRRGIDLPEGLVPATFLAITLDGQLVGRVSIRHELNDFLAREGGHIGYGVRRTFRRRGVATETLRQSLVIARSVGVDDVLVTCDDVNAGSVAVIERCGGVLESVIDVADGSGRLRRYWIR
jgi:predicted acetyltransferase